jgi:micrococcal nuclease|tara:strand:+ start:5972 stop:6406 length:435 start_codon:yes stop_codon:yes gene_type:complete
MWTYRAKVVRVIDGDTVDVDVDLGFGIWQKNERVRIMGIDTPESRTRDKIEKKFGLAAKAKLKSILGKDTVLKTTINKKGVDMKGKFGRVLGDFLQNDKSVAKIMCETGHAVPYFGGNKEDVQKQHMKNRKKLVAEGIVKGAIE